MLMHILLIAIPLAVLAGSVYWLLLDQQLEPAAPKPPTQLWKRTDTTCVWRTEEEYPTGYRRELWLCEEIEVHGGAKRWRIAKGPCDYPPHGQQQESRYDYPPWRKYGGNTWERTLPPATDGGPNGKPTE